MATTHVQTLARPHDAYYDPVFTVSHGADQGVDGGRGTVNPRDVDPAVVGGIDRHKFFRRPVVPYMGAVPADVVFGQTEVQQAVALEEQQEAQPVAASRTVATQSDYRESEAQTDPYSPDYIVRPGSQPELLTLDELKYANGSLPPSMHTLDQIEKLRAKRAWLASLPPMDSEENIELRRKMMEERELLEWGEREDEINGMQERRLQRLQKAMVARENDNEYLEDQRIEYIRQKKMEGKEKVLNTIQQKRVKDIRRLAEQRKHVERKKEKRDVISEFANSGSQVYAPLKRLGTKKDTKAKKVDDNWMPLDLENFEGLNELEATLPRREVLTRIARPEKKKPVRTSERQKLMIENDLANVTQTLQREKLKEVDQAPKVSYLKKVELPPPRPPTPSVEPPPDNTEQEVAILLLQRLIRGRAVQNEMFDGKEKRLELIRELQVEKWYDNSDEARIIQDQQEQTEQEDLKSATLETLEGEIVGQTLDFLSKELVRYQEEKHIAEMVAKAEKTRRMREAEESGLRQKEEQIRAEHDARFRTVMQLHQQTADTYLDTLFDVALETASSLQAIHETRVKSDNITTVLDNMENRLNEPGQVVRDMVQHYLLPNVENETVRREGQLGELKFPLATKQAISDAVDIVEEAEKAAK
eukprot:TRINITY_DN10809_c0_g1_i1.p1 TRINITY_DN10809_c0_g1~~TRINITY_DN10809_c0_g1_i1.p1  ORF type:complete len:645 (-),score=204.67 TRINITY_DN10809_c0_g1_i1:209-2143(-)